MIPDKYYQERIKPPLENQSLKAYVDDIVSSSIKLVNTNNQKKISVKDAAKELVLSAMERLHKPSKFISDGDLNPNQNGYVPKDFLRLKVPAGTTRVTGHVRYNGEIVRPHLRGV
ncbi:MAG: hypothetical protein ACK4NC_07170 [Candidatus Gracilibacteria bacterium]